MRIARPVGLSQDGRSLLVATPSGEQFSIAVDDRLHAALRGDRPRLGQLEIEMENALGPRDIQSRVRAGESVEDVGRVAGIPLDRVERFAAPVLAEREHVALLAMSSSVRRRGETSGHRLLRLAATERLAKRGVDIDTVDWDAYRREDGRWTVTASYSSGESSRQAVFVFDMQGRFSVADNDEARWVLGEQSPVKGPQPGRRRVTVGDGEPDTEPTLDLSDELALVRAIQPDQDPAPEIEPGPAGPSSSPTRLHPRVPRGLHSVPVQQDDDAQWSHARQSNEQVQSDEQTPSDGQSQSDGQSRSLSPLETLDSMLDQDQDQDQDRDQDQDQDQDQDSGQDQSPAPGYGALSDASAVPEIDNSGWEPAIVVDYPVEPSPETPEDGDASEGPADGAVAYRSVLGEQVGEPAQNRARLPSEAPHAQRPATGHGTDLPAPPERIVDGDSRAEEAEELEEEQAAGPPAPRPPGKRKRAAVPSWDEIMFGGPPRPR